MDRSGYNLRWSQWLSDRVSVRGVGGKVSHADLQAGLKARGHTVSISTIGRWVNHGSLPKSADVVEAVGEILHDRSGALLAAGHADETLGRHRRFGDAESVEGIVMARTAEEWDRIHAMTVDELVALAGGRPIVIIDTPRPKE